MPNSPYSLTAAFGRDLAIRSNGSASPIVRFLLHVLSFILKFRARTDFSHLGTSALSGYQREFRVGSGFGNYSQGKRLFQCRLPNTTGVTYVAVDGSGKFT